jgi:hydroxyacylglutathione hydrolase
MARLEVVQFAARSDNFGVLLHDPDSGATAAIDAPDADAVMVALRERGWTLSHIFVTHKHLDHIEGIPALKAACSCEVIGPQRSSAETGMYDRLVEDGDSFRWGGAEIRVIATPGHTLDHVSYWLPEEGLVFVGDTVFALGCGRVIEGTHAMMWESIQRLRELPDDTVLHCGHEYTLANARFAVTVDPGNKRLAERLSEVEAMRSAGKATLPTTIARERATNPFLRADNPAIAAAVGLHSADPAAVFAEIRKRKDRF